MSQSDGAPDLTRPVLGFRSWELSYDGSLRSFARESWWRIGVNEAHCPLLNPPHQAPDHDCLCGLYALHTLMDLTDYGLSNDGLYVVGAIAAWGPMEIHETGFRTRYARMLALADAEAHHDLRLAAAEHYRVPLVPMHRLEFTARAHADPVPRQLLPVRDLWVLVIDCGRSASEDVVWGQLAEGISQLGHDLAAGGDVALVACGTDVSHCFADDGAALQWQLRHLTCGCVSANIALGVAHARSLAHVDGRGYGRVRIVVIAAEPPADPAAFAHELTEAKTSGIESYVVARMSIDELPLWLKAASAAAWVGGADVGDLADEIAMLPR